MSLYSITSLLALETDLSETELSAVSALFHGTEWSGTTITYSFPDASTDFGPDAASYGGGEAYAGFEQANSLLQEQVRQALAMLASLVPITFVELTGSEDADAILRFAMTNATSTAFGYFPGGSAEAGDIWFSADGVYFDNPLAGSYGFQTILHELGHAFGLKHGHDTSGYGALPAELDGMTSSVMTYRSYIGAHDDYYQNEADSYAQSFMPYDIAALQSLYGINWNTNAGRTVYTWDEVTGEMSINGVGQGAPVGPEVFATIWDGGGRDILMLRNFSDDQTIDLRPGGGAHFDDDLLADLSSSVVADANIYFALSPDGTRRSLIEVAKTGSGDDVIYGNAARNLLAGGGGDDVIYGGTGDDKLRGNGGHDRLYGGNGDDRLMGGGGRDRLFGGDGDDRLDGGPGRDKLTGGAGADVFVFRENSNLDRVLDFEVGTDHVDVDDPDLVSLTDFNGNATLMLGDALLVLNGLDTADVVLDSILV
jgi:serralysin